MTQRFSYFLLLLIPPSGKLSFQRLLYRGLIFIISPSFTIRSCQPFLLFFISIVYTFEKSTFLGRRSFKGREAGRSGNRKGKRKSSDGHVSTKTCMQSEGGLGGRKSGLEQQYTTGYPRAGEARALTEYIKARGQIRIRSRAYVPPIKKFIYSYTLEEKEEK